MTYTPWLPPSDTANARTTDTRTFILERRPQFTEMVIPFAWIGGAAQQAGFVSQDTTTLSEAFRSDVIITAPVLQYDFQVTTAYGSGVTSVNYELKVFAQDSAFATTVLLTGTGNSGDQMQGFVDLFDVISPDVYTRYASFRLSVSRNGGSGDGAGVRMVKPWLLRSPSVLA